MRSYVGSMICSARHGEKQYEAYSKYNEELKLRKAFDAARKMN
jgi:hypothetical protein